VHLLLTANSIALMAVLRMKMVYIEGHLEGVDSCRQKVVGGAGNSKKKWENEKAGGGYW